MKHVKEIIISGLSVLLALFVIYSSILHNRLVETRYELESVRQEFARAADQQQRIGEIVRGTAEILNESFVTVKGLREQIAIIRSSYEEMEKLLYSSDTDSSGLNSLHSDEVLSNEEVGRSD